MSPCDNLGMLQGVAVVFRKPDGQSSIRKWKNSAEGGCVCKRHAEELRECLGMVDRMVEDDVLDMRVREMVLTMIQVVI